MEEREIQWVTKSCHPIYPKEHPPFRVYVDEYTEIKQEESMSQKYPEATWLTEYELVDYQGSIIIPWLAGDPYAGFHFFPNRKHANNHVKKHKHLFPKLIEEKPEILI